MHVDGDDEQAQNAEMVCVCVCVPGSAIEKQ